MWYIFFNYGKNDPVYDAGKDYQSARGPMAMLNSQNKNNNNNTAKEDEYEYDADKDEDDDGVKDEEEGIEELLNTITPIIMKKMKVYQ